MILRRDAKVELISKVPLFAGLSKGELRKVASIADELDFPVGKVLIREGAPGREFFVLVEGTVHVERKGRKIDTLKPGDFFGEMALISNAPRNATVTVASPARTLVVTDRDFRNLLKDTPQIALKVLEAFAERAGRAVASL